MHDANTQMMRFPKKFLISLAVVVFAVCANVVLSGMVLAAPTDGPSGTLSAQQLRQCVNDYDGARFNISRDAGAKKFASFKKTDCYKGTNANGPCTYKQTTVVSADNPRDKDTVMVISCSYTAQSGNGLDSDSGVADPAFGNTSCTPTKCTFIDAYVNPFIKLLSVLVAIVAIIAIILGAIQVSTSAGDPQKSASGKNHIRNALIGLVAYALLAVFLNWLIPGGLL